ncbi:MAG: ABC transporter permease [Candidatus Binatia bacterium]
MGRKGWRPETIIQWAAILAVFILVVYPLLLLVWGSFRTDLPFRPGTHTLKNYATIFTSKADLRAVWNTLVVAISATLLATFIGTTLAWITGRTNTPFRRSLEVFSIFPFFLSPFIGALAWSDLANPSNGFLNIFLRFFVGGDEGPLNIYTIYGMIFVMGIYFAPYVFLFTASALKAMDPALEEASRIAGVNTFKTSLKVTLPLVAPSILSGSLLAFVNAAEQFGIPGVLGIPSKTYVITTRIFFKTTMYPSDYAIAAAFAMILMILTGIVIYIQRGILGKRSYITVTGKGYQPRLINIGGWRYVSFSICMIYFLLAVALPYLDLLLASFLSYQTPKITWDLFTLENYHHILFEFPITYRAILNSITLATASATILMILTFVISYIIIRTQTPGRRILDYFSTVPIAVPGLVLGVALLWTYITNPIPIYNTMWILLVAYVTRYIPFGVRATSSALIQIHPELEESSRIHGGSWLRTMRKVTVPLLKSGMLGGWILCFVAVIKNLSISILLYAHGTEIIPVAIWALWYDGQYPDVAAMAMIQTILIYVAIYIAMKATKADSLLKLA